MCMSTVKEYGELVQCYCELLELRAVTVLCHPGRVGPGRRARPHVRYAAGTIASVHNVKSAPRDDPTRACHHSGERSRRSLPRI